jgi:hypothetical protein
MAAAGAAGGQFKPGETPGFLVPVGPQRERIQLTKEKGAEGAWIVTGTVEVQTKTGPIYIPLIHRGIGEGGEAVDQEKAVEQFITLALACDQLGRQMSRDKALTFFKSGADIKLVKNPEEGKENFSLQFYMPSTRGDPRRAPWDGLDPATKGPVIAYRAEKHGNVLSPTWDLVSVEVSREDEKTSKGSYEKFMYDPHEMARHLKGAGGKKLRFGEDTAPEVALGWLKGKMVKAMPDFLKKTITSGIGVQTHGTVARVLGEKWKDWRFAVADPLPAVPPGPLPHVAPAEPQAGQIPPVQPVQPAEREPFMRGPDEAGM